MNLIKFLNIKIFRTKQDTNSISRIQRQISKFKSSQTQLGAQLCLGNQPCSWSSLHKKINKLQLVILGESGPQLAEGYLCNS